MKKGAIRLNHLSKMVFTLEPPINGGIYIGTTCQRWYLHQTTQRAFSYLTHYQERDINITAFCS